MDCRTSHELHLNYLSSVPFSLLLVTLCSEPMWPIEARNAAIANSYFTCAINRVGTVCIVQGLFILLHMLSSDLVAGVGMCFLQVAVRSRTKRIFPTVEKYELENFAARATRLE